MAKESREHRYLYTLVLPETCYWYAKTPCCLTIVIKVQVLRLIKSLTAMLQSAQDCYPILLHNQYSLFLLNLGDHKSTTSFMVLDVLAGELSFLQSVFHDLGFA